MAHKVGAPDFSLQLDRIETSGVQAVVHWGDAEDGAKILNQMRERGMMQPYLACDRCVSDEFLKITGHNAEGVICGYPWNPTRDDLELSAFRKAYRERFGVEAETYATHGYDGMSMLIGAIQTAGLNRAKIRDVIAHRPTPFKGATGEIPLSACLDDLGEVFLARVEGGQYKYYSRDDLQIPRGVIHPRDRASRKTVSAE
jgi:branched-chain amino acid transport system substrate-binding protein